MCQNTNKKMWFRFLSDMCDAKGPQQIFTTSHGLHVFSAEEFKLLKFLYSAICGRNFRDAGHM